MCSQRGPLTPNLRSLDWRRREILILRPGRIQLGWREDHWRAISTTRPAPPGRCRTRGPENRWLGEAGLRLQPEGQAGAGKNPEAHHGDHRRGRDFFHEPESFFQGFFRLSRCSQGEAVAYLESRLPGVKGSPADLLGVKFFPKRARTGGEPESVPNSTPVQPAFFISSARGGQNKPDGHNSSIEERFLFRKSLADGTGMASGKLKMLSTMKTFCTPCGAKLLPRRPPFGVNEAGPPFPRSEDRYNRCRRRGTLFWSEGCPCLPGKISFQVHAGPIRRGKGIQVLNTGKAGKIFGPPGDEPLNQGGR